MAMDDGSSRPLSDYSIPVNELLEYFLSSGHVANANPAPE
jgi:hypothetical protein